MTDQLATVASTIHAACKAGAERASAALATAFGGSFEISVSDPVSFEGKIPPDLDGPGLGIVFQGPALTALLFISGKAPWLPSWYASSDEGIAARLNALGTELSAAIFPGGRHTANVSPIDKLSLSPESGRLETGASIVALNITAPSGTSVAWMVSMIPDTDRVLSPTATPSPTMGKSPSATQSSATVLPKSSGGSARHMPLRYRDLDEGLWLLPSYARSLLRIKVSVTVTLAQTKQPVRKIMEIGPGAIIQFNKSCEEMLTLEIDNQDVAIGEAVKVGDKFGLRVTAIAMPEERFTAVGRMTLDDNGGG